MPGEEVVAEKITEKVIGIGINVLLDSSLEKLRRPYYSVRNRVKPYADSYKFISADLNITIYNNNRGIGIATFKMRVLKDNINKMKHAFGISDCGTKNLKLKQLSALTENIKRDVHCRFGKEMTLACKLISKNGEDIDHGSRWLSLSLDRNKSSDKSHVFYVKLKNMYLKVGDVVIYRYAFSLPNMYPTKKSNTNSYKTIVVDDIDYCRSVFSTYETYGKLNFSISFEEGINPPNNPRLFIGNSGTEDKSFLCELEKEEDMYYTRCKTSIKKVRHNRDCTLMWDLS